MCFLPSPVRKGAGTGLPSLRCFRTRTPCRCPCRANSPQMCSQSVFACPIHSAGVKVTLFIPCFVDLMYPKVGISMVQILERLGHTVACPEAINCCGQPAFNSGYWPEARLVAVNVLDKLKDAEVVVIASGSCGAMLKVFYRELFAGTEHEHAAEALAEKCFEFSDFLVRKL